MAEELQLDLTGATLEDTNKEEDTLDLSGASLEGQDQGTDNTLSVSQFAVLDKASAAGLEGFGNYELPEPDMTMYDDIEPSGLSTLNAESLGQALRRYNMYANHPDAERGIDGALIYKGKVVPEPEGGLIGDHSPGIGQMLYGGVRNTIANTAELGGAIIDKAREGMQNNVGQAFLFNEKGEFDPDWKTPEEIAAMSDEEFQTASMFGGKTPFTEMAQDGIAKVKPGDSIANSLLMEGTSMMVPGLLAMKMINYAGKGAKLAKFLAFEAGASAGTSTEGSSLLLGENAMFKGAQDVFPILKGVQYEPGSPEYDKVLANRANILMEAMAIGKTFEKGIEATTWASRFAWSISGAPLLNIARPTAKEDALAREILNTLTGVTDDPASMKAAREGILKLVEDNKQVWLEMPEGLADDIKYTADTMTALQRALDAEDTELAQEIIQRAQSYKKGVMTKGAPKTTIATSRPANAFEDVTQQTEEVLGGGANTPNINTAADDIASQGIDEVNTASARVYNLENQIKDVDDALAQVIESGDAGIISKVNDLESTVGFDITKGANASADSLRDNLSQASKVMDDEKNRLFGLVEGGAVDIDDMVNTLQSLKPGQLDIAASALPGDSMLGKLLDQVKLRSKEVDGQIVRETEDEMRARVAKWANNNGLDYAKLFTDVRISLSDSIGRMTGQTASAAEKGAAQSLIKFKDWIDNDAISYLRETGDDATIEAAENALGYFKNTWAKYWDDGSVLTDVGRLRRETVGRGKQTPKFLDESRNLVTDSLNNRNREVVGNMIDLLKRPEGGESATDVVDYIIGDTLTKISSRVDSPEKLATLDIGDLRTSVSEYASIIRTNFPDEAKRLDDFLETLRTAKGDKQYLENQLKIAKDQAKAAEERIFNRELKAFYEKAGIPNVNGYDSFQKLFNNAVRVGPEGSVEQGNLIRVLQMAQEAADTGNPIIMKGIQSAYSRFVRENFLTATREAGGNRMVGMAALNKSENNLSQVLAIGQNVFADEPLVMRAIEGILGEAGLVQRSRNVKASGVGSNTAEAQAAMRAVDRTVTLTLGVLSRAGARIRSAASGYISSKLDPEETLRVLDKLMADPDYFIEVSKRVIDKDGGVNPDNAMALRQWLIRSGLYSENNETDEDFFLKLADAELAFDRASNEMDQTVDALQNAIIE